MNFPKTAGLMLGAALAFGLTAAGQAAPASPSRNVEAASIVHVPVEKAAAKSHKSTKHTKQTKQTAPQTMH